MKPNDTTHTPNRRTLAIAASAALLLCGTISRAASPEKPDIVIILADSLCADHVGCYGYHRDTTPGIDAFAKRAVRFDEAVASGSWTQPSIMTLFTSVSPDIHQRVLPATTLASNVVTLAEALKKEGYQTIGITSNMMTHRQYGFAKGFDVYDDFSVSLAPSATSEHAASQAGTSPTLTRLAQNKLNARDPDKPLFLFVLYIDPHWDYLPPAPYDNMFTNDPVPAMRQIWALNRRVLAEDVKRRIVDAYDGEIRYTDSHVANLIAFIEAESPKKDNTAIVFCADHGEAFWERGFVSHGNNLYEEEVRVPLVIQPPKTRTLVPDGGAVVTGQVGLIDVAPTLLDLAGITPPATWQGRSLVPYLGGGTVDEKPIVMETRIRKGIERGVRTSRYKITARAPFATPAEAYDLVADPSETNNLVTAGAPLPDEIDALIPLLKPADYNP